MLLQSTTGHELRVVHHTAPRVGCFNCWLVTKRGPTGLVGFVSNIVLLAGCGIQTMKELWEKATDLAKTATYVIRMLCCGCVAQYGLML